MKEIKVGLNVKFPASVQKAHSIVMEQKEHPPECIKYGWATPKNLNNEGVYFHPKRQDFDLLEASDNPFLTSNRWIYSLATVEFALNLKFNQVYYQRQKRIEIIRKIFSKDSLKKIIFFSKTGLESLSAYAGITDKKIIEKSVYLYNAVPDIRQDLINKKKKDKDKFRILFIGTAFYLKGGASLVDAFEILQKKYPFIELELHSSLMKEGYLDNELYQPLHHEKTIQQIKNNPSIFNYNSFDVSRQKILQEVYPRADLFILPSLQEGMPYVIQEAMSYGLPIISTNCTPSIPEIVEEGKNGLIINIQGRLFEKLKDMKDNKGKMQISKEFQAYLTKEIVENISTLISDNKLADKIRINNLKKSKDLFSFKNRNKQLRNIYEEAYHD